jgi:hypothetical protein
MNLKKFIKEEVAIALAEDSSTGAFRRLVIMSTSHDLIQSSAAKYLTQNTHMYPALTFKIIPSPKPNTFVIDLVGNGATTVSIKLRDLAKKLDKTANVLVRKEKKLGVKESITKKTLSVNESVMSDINLMAQEAKDFNSFVKEFMKEYSNESADNTQELKNWLQSIYNDAKENIGESVLTEPIESIKSILGVKFKMEPTPDHGIKFEFTDFKQFIKSGLSINEMIDKIQKMLDDKFGKGLFQYKSAIKLQPNHNINRIEFKQNINHFLKVF